MAYSFDKDDNVLTRVLINSNTDIPADKKFKVVELERCYKHIMMYSETLEANAPHMEYFPEYDKEPKVLFEGYLDDCGSVEKCHIKNFIIMQKLKLKEPASEKQEE